MKRRRRRSKRRRMKRRRSRRRSRRSRRRRTRRRDQRERRKRGECEDLNYDREEVLELGEKGRSGETPHKISNCNEKNGFPSN